MFVHRFTKLSGLARVGFFLCLITAAQEGPADAQELPFVVIVHEDNPTEALSQDEVSRIFLKKTLRWDDGVEIVPVDQDHFSEVRKAFTRAIHGRSINTILGYWQRMILAGRSTPPEQHGSDAAVLAGVKANRGAIGYVSPCVWPAPGVKALSLEGFSLGMIASATWDCQDDDDETHVPAAPHGVTVDQRGAFYVSSREGGLLRSVDRGETWEALDLGQGNTEIREVLAHPKRPETIFVGTSEAVLFSTDRGTSFRTVEISDGVRRLFIDPQRPEGLEILAGEGTYWRWHLESKAPREQTAVLRSAAGLGSSPARGSSNGQRKGASSTADNASDPGGVGAFAIHPEGLLRAAAVEGRVLRSTDGELWERHVELPVRVVDLAFQPGVRDTLFIATVAGLWRSTDGGANLERTSLEVTLRRILVGSNLLYALSSSALWIGDLEGLSWRQAASVEDGELFIDPQDTSRLVLLSKGGEVVTSSDGGQTWTRSDTTRRPLVATFKSPPKKPSPATSLPSPTIESLQLRCGRDGAHVAALATVPGEVNRVYAGGLHGVWRSDDAGRSWSFSGQGLELTDVHTLAVDPRRSRNLWAGTHGGGLYRSIDEGATWRRVSGPAVIHALAIDPLATDVLWAGTPDGLWSSEDGGVTWHFADEQIPTGGRAPGTLRVRDLVLEGRDPLSARNGGRNLRFDRAVPGELGASEVFAGGKTVSRRCRGEEESELKSQDLAALELDRGALPIRALAFDATGEHLFAATPLGLWRRGRRGFWHRLRLKSNLTSLAAVHVDGETALLAGGLNGIWRVRNRHYKRVSVYPPQQTGQERLADEQWPKMRSFRRPTFALAGGPSGIFYAGLDHGQVVTAEYDPGVDGFVRRFVDLPAFAPRILPQNADSSGVPLIGARVKPGGAAVPAPGESMAGQDLLWRRLVATPRYDVRRRALLATKLLTHLSTERYDRLDGKTLLLDPLEDLADPPSASRLVNPSQRDTLRGVMFSPDGRWLLGEHLFADRERFHSELRLYDLAAVAETVVRGRMSGGVLDWWEVHDLALEPVHLQPLWVLPDAGDVLAWSPDGRYLLTLADADRLMVWHLGALPPGTGGPVPSPSVAVGRSVEVGQELMAELVGGLAPTLRELARGRSLRPIKLSTLAGRVALSYDGQRIAFSGRDAEGALLHVLVPSGEAHTLHSLRVPGEMPPDLVRFTHDGAWLLSFSRDVASTGGAARAWHLDTWLQPSPPGAELRWAPDPFHVASQTYNEAVLSSGGRWLATRAGGALTLWDLSVWEHEDAAPALPGWELLTSAGLSPPRFSPSGDWLSVSTYSGESILWRLDGEGPTQALTVKTDGRMPLFGEGGFQLHGPSSSHHWRLDELPLRQEARADAAVAASPLWRWDGWHRAWTRRDPREPTPPWLRSPDNAWHAAVHGNTLWLLHLAPLDPGVLLGRIGRYGPVGLHLDEGSAPEKVRDVGDLGEHTIDDLR